MAASKRLRRHFPAGLVEGGGDVIPERAARGQVSDLPVGDATQIGEVALLWHAIEERFCLFVGLSALI
jgi:hypothetical protein